MRLYEFLAFILEAHGQTLRELSDFLGEDTFLALLEEAGELNSDKDGAVLPALAEGEIPFFPEKKEGYRPILGGFSPYGFIEGTVRELALPEVLEFHLWSYPGYRKFMESRLALETVFDGAHAETLIKNARDAELEWYRSLPMQLPVSMTLEKALAQPWLRFRTQVLQRCGIRTLGALKCQFNVFPFCFTVVPGAS